MSGHGRVSRTGRVLKRKLRATVGLWPLHEMRNKLVLGGAALVWKSFENREVARLSTATAELPYSLVTTVIPTFRRPEQVRAAVLSALGQTIIDHTVIVVDDGGGGLPELPDDPRLVVVALSRNCHVLGLVRNVGIRLTRSEFIAFLDDDNIWYPGHLEQALGSLRAGADFIYTAIRRVNEDGAELDVLSRPFNRKEFADTTPYVDSNAIVVRRSAKVYFSRLPRVKSTLPKEDWEFVYRLSRRSVVRHVPAATVRYLVNNSSYYTDWRVPNSGPKEDDPANDG